MINGLQGIPGSGKSYEAVVYHVLHALQAGRKVITNLPVFVDKFAAIDPAYPALIELRRRPQPIRGEWDANRMDDNGNGNAFELFEDQRTVEPGVDVTVFGHVWDYYTTWKHPETGQGPLIVIDECHTALPGRDAGVTDKEVVQWFKLHRHFNVDVLLMTQDFRDMNQPIARLMEMLVKCRKASFMGKPTEYIRKVCAGYRGAVISTESRPYKPQYFGLYKSHTQGNSVAEGLAADVSPMLVRFKRWTRGVWLLALCFGGWFAWSLATGETKPVKAPPSQHAFQPIQPPQKVAEPQQAAVALLPPPVAVGPLPEADKGYPEPLQGKGIHLRGHLVMAGRDVYVFLISNNGQPGVTHTSDDLARMGYRWEPSTACTGTLLWRDKARPIMCDSPQVSM